MQRELILLVTLVFLCVILIQVVEGKLCPSMDIRNYPSSLDKLRNCTVVVGFLKILLFDKVDSESEYSEYTFPELTEITDYLLVFKLTKLTTLATLFPNLRVIRGVKLFTDYALVIYQMPDLREVGLHNLMYIARGSVIVDNCPFLCYVDTIDWKKIGPKLDFTNTNYGYCEPCPRACNGYCWNVYDCQNLDLDKCHEQCLGCSKYNSSSHCNTCKNLEDSGTCVETCPKNKYLNKYTSKCVTKEECETMLNGTWWIFQNECLRTCPPLFEQIDPIKGGCKFCGNNCVRKCPPTVVDSLAVLQELYACTHINGTLEIRVSKSYVAKELEENVGKIVEIQGGLRIGRSKAITSLEFLKSLRYIGGEEFIIFENQNLQKLWNFSRNFSMVIKSKKIAFHNNPQLCYSEIEKLANVTNTLDRIDTELLKYSNGYKSSCNIRELNIMIVETNSTNVSIIWEPIQIVANATIIGYTIYYIESGDKNITAYESDTVCDDNGWNSFFISNNTYNLTNLKPFTRYAFYLRTYSTSLLREQTPIHYFVTSPDDPTEPLNVEAIPTSDTSIKLKWQPPQFINGLLSHYTITMYLEEDYLPLIDQRNYCHYPHIPELEDVIETTTETWVNDTISNCTCSLKQEIKIFQQDIASLCETDGLTRYKSTSCNNFLYSISNNVQDPNEIVVNKRNSVKKAFVNIGNHRFQEIKTDNANLTTYEVKKLKHYSLYVFFLSACNVDTKQKKYCGPYIMVSARTKKRVEADNIVDVLVSVDKSNAYVQWLEPDNPNSLIVAYQIEHKRVDLEHSKSILECITRKQYHRNRKHKILNLLPGKYSIKVQTISLAGPGLFSSSQVFEIAAPRDSLFWLYIVLLISLVVLSLIAFVVYHWYKKKHMLDNIHLITSINPDYAGIYIEDEWEIERSDVDILGEIGKGSFGMVYQGLIKSKNLACAIKTVNDNASMLDRSEFLNEGSVMKNFNDAHHVIKLLGIVSRGQPPYVIMELMERGDLKKYLYRSREPSQNLTTNEMYRMAAEIADGMAYLTARKYVHRDLAARNCMVHADRTVKIGDFGMARDIYETDYYKKETVGLLPVRWMAPESLADGVFTSDSDCWSYGIVLWEIATLAEQPYQGLSNEEVFRFVKNGGKLSRPNECSDKFYEIMKSCWEWKPNDRPTFRAIVDNLVSSVGEGFRLVAFCYSKKGAELALNAGPRPFNPAAMISDADGKIYGHYNVSDDNVNLFVGETSRPKNYYPFSSPDQRFQKPSPNYPNISPGSPDSYSLHSESS